MFLSRVLFRATSTSSPAASATVRAVKRKRMLPTRAALTLVRPTYTDKKAQ